MTSILIQLQCFLAKHYISNTNTSYTSYTTASTCVRRLTNIYNQISLNVNHNQQRN
jgi:hypothetical protein